MCAQGLRYEMDEPATVHLAWRVRGVCVACGWAPVPPAAAHMQYQSGLVVSCEQGLWSRMNKDCNMTKGNWPLSPPDRGDLWLSGRICGYLWRPV